MHELTVAAKAGLTLAGLTTLAMVLTGFGSGAGIVAQHLQLMTAATGVALILAVPISVLRLPALTVGILTKLSYLLAWLVSGAVEPTSIWRVTLESASLLLLLGAGAVFVHDARREARWNGGQSLRLES